MKLKKQTHWNTQPHFCEDLHCIALFDTKLAPVIEQLQTEVGSCGQSELDKDPILIQDASFGLQQPLMLLFIIYIRQQIQENRKAMHNTLKEIHNADFLINISIGWDFFFFFFTKIRSFIHVILLHFKGKNTDVCSECQGQRQPPTPSPNGKHICTHGISTYKHSITGLEQPSGQGDPARLKGGTFPLLSCASDLSQRPHYPGHQQK